MNIAFSTPTQDTTAFSNTLSPGKWVMRITEAWQKQVPAILEVAMLLEAADAELRKRDYMAMVRKDLPFSQSTATKLSKIAKCSHLNSDHGPNLPACWRTIYELTLLTPTQFEHGIKTGVINPKMQRKDVKVLRGQGATPTGTKTSSAFAKLKDRSEEQAHEIQKLKAQLANVQDGSLYDLKKDKLKDIAAVFADTITEARANALFEEVKTAFKAKKLGTSNV
jgi:hypothetical protein